jgi:hypothetical protein
MISNIRRYIMKKFTLISIIIILILTSLSGFYIISKSRENEIINTNKDNSPHDFKPPTGVRRDPMLRYNEGSNPSQNKPWPMFQHDLQHTSFVKGVGTGDISNYGLLYHRWDYSFSQPVVADFDSDGRNEIFVYSEGFEGTIGLFKHNGDLLWSHETGSDIWATPVIADINDDDNLEIVVGLRMGEALIAFDAVGNQLWEFPVNGYVESSPAIADINKDGKMDIVFGASPMFDPGSVYAVYSENNNPHLLWKFNADDDISSVIMSSPALMDIDEDGELETIIGSYNNYLYVIDSNGQLLWKFQMEGSEGNGYDGIYSSPVIADLDGDGTVEIIIATLDKKISYDNKIYCLDINGNKLWDFKVGSEVAGSLSIADLNGDGWLEILFGAYDSLLYVLNTEGDELWTYDLGYPTGCSPTIVDLDGDGNLEIIIVSAPRGEEQNPCGNVMFLNNSGSLLWKHVIDGDTWTHPPVVDLNGDERFEILIGVYSGDDGADYGLYVFGDMSSSDLHDTLPDLSIHNWTVHISHPSLLETTVSADVRNIGLVNVSNIDVKFETPEREIGTKTIEKLNALSEVTVEMTWNGYSDEVIVTVDPNDNIEESDENNNKGTEID